MKFRLDSDHFVSETSQLLPAGTEVGDGCPETWRYPETAADPSLRGKPRPPSNSMTGLDDEGKKMIRSQFGTDAPERDPTKAIPISGVHRDAAGHQTTPKPTPPTPRTGESVAKDPSVATEKVSGPGKA